MKYLSNYLLFTESITPFMKAELLTEADFNKLYNENCQNYIKSGVKLYRGINNVVVNGNYYYQEKGLKRKSIESQNIHVLIMSESERWMEFPKYDSSIIGSTNLESAESYSTMFSRQGVTFEMIPYDGTKLGMCTKNIWMAFGGFYDSSKIRKADEFLSRLGISTKNLNWKEIKQKLKSISFKFNPTLEIRQIQDYAGRDFKLINFLLEFDYWTKYKTFTNIDVIGSAVHIKNKNNDFITLNYNTIFDINDFIDLESINPTEMIEYIEGLFDPALNKIQCLELNEKTKDKFEGDHQVWCEGPVLLKVIDKRYI
jgi:hypothetical protein